MAAPVKKDVVAEVDPVVAEQKRKLELIEQARKDRLAAKNKK